jgi:formiminoglutamase
VGVRRNRGRPGAALAPDLIREMLYRLTSWDGVAGVDLAHLGLLDLGHVRVGSELEAAQQRLGDIVAAVLKAHAVPIVIGGGHETSFGHYLGYVGAGIDVAIINVDAHLDVRPFTAGGHSGSPFRQAMEHAVRPLNSGQYVVIGAQRQSVARAHADYVAKRNGRVHWLPETVPVDWPLPLLSGEMERMRAESGAVLLTVDADAFRQADVPGTSAPSPVGLDGRLWPDIAFLAGTRAAVRSIDLVEVNPNFDRDGQTTRWAASGIRQFLVGLAIRKQSAENRI